MKVRNLKVSNLVPSLERSREKQGNYQKRSELRGTTASRHMHPVKYKGKTA